MSKFSDLRPYPEYRDSGLPWLGAVPSRWDVCRNGRLFAQRNEMGFGDLPILEVSLKTGVRVRDFHNSKRKQVMSNRDNYKRAAKGDIAYNMMRLWQGAVGTAPVDGLVSPAYVVARPFAEVDSRYYAYLFRTDAYMNEVNKYSRGIVTDRNRLYWDEFKQMPSPFPPTAEQRAIADFLDHHGRAVRRFIRNRRRLIELLNEQKQAIIDQYVTGKLDPRTGRPYPRYKPSGIDWLGDVPEHWEALKVKRIARIDPARTEAYHLRDSDEPVTFLPMERITAQGEVDSSDLRPARQVWQGFTYFRRGDVVVAKITPCFENGKGACLVSLPTEHGFGTTELIVLRATAKVSPPFLYQLTMLGAFRRLGVESMTGAAGQQRISPDFVANFTVPVPPIDEQLEILGFIQRETAKFSISIRRAAREIALVQEYRTRLITDVVTGKVDVRHLAPVAGEAAAEEPEPWDEEEDVIDGQDAENLETVEEMADADD